MSAHELTKINNLQWLFVYVNYSVDFNFQSHILCNCYVTYEASTNNLTKMIVEYLF